MRDNHVPIVGKRLIFKAVCISLFLNLTLLGLLAFKTATASENVFQSGQKTQHASAEFFTIDVKNGLVSMTAKNADIRKVLREFASISKVNIHVAPEVEGTLSTHLHDIPIASALEQITQNSGIVFEKDGDTYHVIKVIVPCSSHQSTKAAFSGNKTFSPNPSRLSSKTPRTNLSQDQLYQQGRSHADRPLSKGKSHVAGEMVIQFKQNTSRSEIINLISGIGAVIKHRIAPLRYYVLMLPAHLPAADAMKWFQQQNVVEKMEPNYLIPIGSYPDDPEFPMQWALDNHGQTNGTLDADIDGTEAWSIEPGDPDVIIAVIDTGVEYTHEDLVATIWNNEGETPNNGVDDDGNGYVDDTLGWDFVDTTTGASGEDLRTPDNDPMDGHGHGTHVAGIVAAMPDNALGVAGVAGNCRIMPVRAGYKTLSGGGELESVSAAEAILYAAENGASILNLSWGNYQKSNLIADAIEYAANKGCLILAAAGNENTDEKIYPAALDNPAVIAVGATDHNDQRASYSNYGMWVDVSGPGSSIVSTCLANSYCYKSGTSMATPHVSGAAALLFSFFPGIDPLEAKARILRSADVLEGLDQQNGVSGRLNAYRSLVDSYSEPFIFSLSPKQAHEGDEITLSGDRFGEIQGEGSVFFDQNIVAEIISWSNATIVCKVPVGATTGDVTVSTTEGRSNGKPFVLLKKYYDETLISNGFLGGGEPQGWQADDQSWLYQLPFPFPFFGKVYEQVYVCSNGFLDFGSNAASNSNSEDLFKSRIMIAPLWDDLATNGSTQPGEDIYIHSPSPDAVCFRWAAQHYDTHGPVNMEVILYQDGKIQFNYGMGNANLTPTIGVSGGDGQSFHFSTLKASNMLTHAETVQFLPIALSFNLDLDIGWNLISLPVQPEDPKIAQIFAEAMSDIDSIWGYQGGQWQVFVAGDSGFSDLSEIKAGFGYWVKSNKDGIRIQIQGKRITKRPDCIHGWNLMGYNFCNEMGIADYFAEKNGGYETIWRYYRGQWKVYDFNNPAMSDLMKMEPGYGYWIKKSW